MSEGFILGRLRQLNEIDKGAFYQRKILKGWSFLSILFFHFCGNDHYGKFQIFRHRGYKQIKQNETYFIHLFPLSGSVKNCYLRQGGLCNVTIFMVTDSKKVAGLYWKQDISSYTLKTFATANSLKHHYFIKLTNKFN